MKFLLCITTLASLGITAHASTIYILSDALDTTNDSSNPTMDIVRSAAWAPAFAGSDWISYGPTGAHTQPGYFSPPNGTIVTFTTQFTLTGLIVGGRLRVLADDTTSVVLNGHTLISPDLTFGSACAAKSIGCLVSTEGVFDFAALSPYLKDGINTLSFAVSQLGGSSFGLDFKGSVRTDPAQTPEPSAWAVIGGGLLCLAIFRKRN
jgi:hypothetical protein